LKLKTQLYLSFDPDFINEEKSDRLLNQLEIVKNYRLALINYYRSQLEK
jgi:hypothetical protein